MTEVRKRIDYILDNIYIFLLLIRLAYRSFYRIQKYYTIRIFPGYENFLGYGRPDIKSCKNSCRNLEYENFQDMEIILDMNNYPGYGSLTPNYILYKHQLTKTFIKYIICMLRHFIHVCLSQIK